MPACPKHEICAARRGVTDPPAMFRRPADPPERPDPVRGSDTIRELHSRWAHLHSPATSPGTVRERIVRLARVRAARLGLGCDPELLGDLVRALDAVAGRCDELSDRVHDLEIVVADVARIFGEEVTRLRASVALQARQAPPESSPSH
jgi:hypothetical protein